VDIVAVTRGPARSLSPVRFLLLAVLLAVSACTGQREGAELPPLLVAVLQKDSARVAALLRDGADANGALEATSEALVAHGIEVEPGQRIVVSPLLIASHNGSRDIVSHLLAHGADPNQANPDGVTPLLVAAAAGHTEIAGMLVESGARPGERTAAGEAPLLAAIENRDWPLLELLLDAGADPHVVDARGSSPRFLALSRGDAELMALLQRHGVPLDPRDPILADATIDTTGFDPRFHADPAAARRLPLGVAVDAADGRVYWTEYETQRIRRIAAAGSRIETVVADTGDGPIGLAIAAEADRMCWTGDGSFPRYVRCSDRAGEDPHTLALGPIVNRPRAIAATAGAVFWTETVNGKLRRVQNDEAGVTDLFVDGISSGGDRIDASPFFSLGLAVAPASGRLFWSDFHGEAIGSVLADGSGRTILFSAGDGVDFPVGVAVHRAGDTIFWVDVAREAILRASLDGGGPEVVIDTADGLIEPRAIALDEQRKRLYWTDATRDAIGRATLDGSRVEWLPLDRGDAASFGALPVPGDCRAAIRETAATFVRRAGKRVGVCLEKVDAAKSVKRKHDDVRPAVRTCQGQLVTLAVSGKHALGPQVEALRDGVCRGEAIDPAAVLAGCGVTAADCSSLDCAIAGCREGAWLAVARQHLRAAEWLEELRPFVDPPAAGVADAERVGVLVPGVVNEIVAVIERQEPAPGIAGSLPATGLQTSYRAVRRGDPAWRPIQDDGALRAGARLRFRDNRDGTLSDLTTGLMWEKKCDRCDSLHAESSTYLWSSDGTGGVIWDWIDQVNLEGGTGFAGYDDWRIPNVKELLSIIDYERFNPAVGRAFDGDRCGLGCTDLTDPACNCTALTGYWSATTLAHDTDRALVVTFNLGLIGDASKVNLAAVRAVRGGLHADPEDVAAASPGAGGD
jgi:hypothetical protein